MLIFIGTFFLKYHTTSGSFVKWLCILKRYELREGLKELSHAKLPLVGEKVGDFFSNVSRLGDVAD
jgi:hypothetical protein